MSSQELSEASQCKRSDNDDYHDNDEITVMITFTMMATITKMMIMTILLLLIILSFVSTVLIVGLAVNHVVRIMLSLVQYLVFSLNFCFMSSNLKLIRVSEYVGSSEVKKLFAKYFLGSA